MDSNSLSHTKWNCKYHIVFAPKYRRKVAYGKIKQDIACRVFNKCYKILNFLMNSTCNRKNYMLICIRT